MSEMTVSASTLPMTLILLSYCYQHPIDLFQNPTHANYKNGKIESILGSRRRSCDVIAGQGFLDGTTTDETPSVVARRDHTYTQTFAVSRTTIVMAELQLAIKARALVGVHKPARLYRSICK